MTISNPVHPQGKQFFWKDLQEIDFTFQAPFFVALTDKQFFNAEQIVRLIPKKRMVVFGTWLGKPAVAKLFFEAQHAKRHADKEVQGIKCLQENKIPTPELYYQGVSEDRRLHILIFERLLGAQSLEEKGRIHPNIEDWFPLLQEAIIELATQHALGVLQHDLHLKNFLIRENMIYTLDGAEIEFFHHPLPKKQSLESLALFLSQLGVGIESYQKKLFLDYANARGWLIKTEDLTTLFLIIKQITDKRWQKFAKKIFRNSSHFCRIKNGSLRGMYNRDYAKPELLHFLRKPESAFTHASATLLKDGRSSTVLKVVFDEQTFVIKRYNIKTVSHFLRRCLRTTRAASCWRLAQKFYLFWIPTAKPVAYLERKYLGLSGKSYYVMEYVQSEYASEYFKRYHHQKDKIYRMIQNIANLFKKISRLSIIHGDLKISNILLDENEQLLLIDLDGSLEYLSLPRLEKAWRKEIRRFLENFSDAELKEQFKIAWASVHHQ